MKQAGHLKVTGFSPVRRATPHTQQGRAQCHLHHLHTQPAMEVNGEKAQGKTPQVLWHFTWKCVHTEVFEFQKFLTVL